jgi:hypothetical protein
MWFPFAMTTLAVADSSLGGRSAAGSMAFCGIPLAQAQGSHNWPACNTTMQSTAILGRDVTIERDLNGQVRQAWNS